MDDFDSIVSDIDGDSLELDALGANYLAASINFWQATQRMAAQLRAGGMNYLQAYGYMQRMTADRVDEWKNSKAETLFTLAWALQEQQHE